MNVVLPFITTAVVFVFAILVLWQFFSRHKAYQLVWGIALVMFGIGTGSQLVASIWGWSLVPYQLYWLFGAFFTAAFLGQGTLYLLVPRWLANVTMAILVLASLVVAYLVFAAPIDTGILAKAGAVQPSEAMPGGIRFLTMPFNVYGTLALVGGAIYSAVFYWRKKARGDRAWGNILIAVGTIFIGAGGGLSKLGGPEYHSLAQLIGAILIFVGFLKTR
ncbi:MAG: hypothetical protein HYX94_08755 [Chloroflexi bacterium]|nr:hypothetical protein [Chloroflexota bacterium]